MFPVVRVLGGKRGVPRLRSARLRAIPTLQLLEERIDPSGTTVITHGYSLSSQFGSDSWVRAMGNSIAARTPGTDVFLMYDNSANELRYDGGAKVAANFQAGTGSEEYIVYVSWETASGRSAPGWAESTAEGLYGTLRRYGLADANHPLHFIGHSYGTVVNSEVIQRLGYLDNLTVDQMTTLDPHDFYEAFTGFILPTQEIGVKQPDVHVWSNIIYADNYYNTAGSSSLFDPLPHGRALDGALTSAAINYNLSSLNGFNVSGSAPHSRVHEYYALTIDPNINIFDTVNHSTWFVPGPSTNYGYRYSRIGAATTSGGSEADRVAHFAGYSQRTNVASPPDNSANDVGKDPPARIYNGDFFNTTAGSGLLAGYTGSPQITGAPANPAALLNSAGKSFTHLPVFIPQNAGSFAFDYTVTGPASGDALTVTFTRDDNQTYTFTDAGILLSPGSSTRTINLANFPSFGQLTGRMASIGFTLNTTQSTTSLAVDNLRIAIAPPTVTNVVFGDGSNQRSTARQIVVTFSEPVNFSPSVASAFTLHRSGTGGTIGNVDLTANPPAGPANSVTITFSGALTESGGSLVDGLYDFMISAAQVSGAGGALDGNSDQIPGGSYSVIGTTANQYFRFYGDDNGDGTVNQVDFNAFRLAFLGGPSVEFDFDNDGQVSQPDFDAFRLRFLGTP